MESIIKQTLEVDKKYRELCQTKSEGVSDDLFALNDIVPNEWDYSMPTISSGKAIKLVRDMTDFIQAYNSLLPFVKCPSGFLIAGGAVSNLLSKSKSKSNRINDVDVFIYGVDVTTATNMVDSYIELLHTSYKDYLQELEEKSDKSEKSKSKRNDKVITYDFKCIRNNNCVTVMFDSYVIQIILRVYDNISQILHGFDLGSSAVGYDGKRLYFTSLSKVAYEYSCNILDTSRRSTTYERRLIKYFDRKFDIILPNFNINALRNVNVKYGIVDVCEMPHLVFSYKNIKGNRIKIDRFLSPCGDGDSDYQVENLQECHIFYINLHNLVWGKEDFYFYTERIADVLTCKPLISRRRIIDYYNRFIVKLRENDSINLRMLKKYIKNTEPILKIFAENGGCDKQLDEVLSRAVNEEKEHLLTCVDELQLRQFPLKWITENPGTQLTSSINPIIEDVKDWYGSYYV